MAIKINGNIVIDDSQNSTLTGTQSVTGNVTGGNLITAGNLIVNGVALVGSGTNLLIGSNTVVTANPTGTSSTTGNIAISGNITAGNVITPAVYTSNITGAAGQNIIIAADGTGDIHLNTDSVRIGDNNTAATLVTRGAGNLILRTHEGDAAQGNITIVNGADGNIQLNPNGTGVVVASGPISATGNVTGSFFIGNGSQLSGLPATYGNANVVANLAALGSNPVSTTGTVTAGNINTSGSVSATGNVNAAGRVSTTGDVIAGGQVSGSSLAGTSIAATSGITGGSVSVTGNVTSGNVSTAGTVSAAGNITGSFFIGNGSQLTGIVSSYGNANVVANLAALGSNPVSTTGNVTGGNFNTAGQVSATGNVTGSFFIGNGSQLSGIVSSYGNANVVANLAALGSNPVSTTGNVTAGNVIISGNITTPGIGGNITGATLISAETFQGNVSATTVSATGNVTGGNLNVTGNIVDTGALSIITASNGNITLAPNGTGIVSATSNIVTSGTVSATGNITGNFFIGNGSQLTGIASSYGNANVVANLAALGSNPVSTTGNVTGGNLITTGVVTATGNITGGNVTTAGQVSATGNVTGGNIRTVGLVSATGTVTGSQFNGSGDGLTSIPGANVTGTVASATSATTATTATSATTAGTVTTAAQANITSVGTLTSLSVTGNITGGNIATAGTVTADTMGIGGGTRQSPAQIRVGTNQNIGFNSSGGTTARISAYNDAGTASVPLIFNGGTDLSFTIEAVERLRVNSIGTVFVTGNVSATGTVTGSQFTGSGAGLTSIPGANVTGTVASATSATTATTATSATTAGTVTTAAQANITSVGTLTSLSVTGNVAGGNITTGGQVSATGNVSAGNINVTGNIVDTGALSIITSSNGNITLAPNGTGVVVVNTDLRNGQANGVGNIGSAGGSFNTVFAKATSAQYADVAERYTADAVYAPGTVLMFGGTAEVTIAVDDATAQVAGVVTTDPALLMNDQVMGVVADVALLGRVPVRVVGSVSKGDMLVSAGQGRARAESNPKMGTVIGKSLAAVTAAADEESTVEVVVGRI